MVEGNGFENRRTGNCTRGSNPFSSAKMVSNGILLGFAQTHQGLRAPGPAPGPVLDLTLVCPPCGQTKSHRKMRVDTVDEFVGDFAITNLG